MSRRTFSLFFLFLFVCCQLCQQGRAVHKEIKPVVKKDPITEFFTPEDEQISTALKAGDGQGSKITVKNIKSVILAVVDGVLIALTNVSYTIDEKGEKSVILAKYTEAKKKKWNNEIVKNSDTNWKMELAAKDLKKTESDVVIKSFAVAAEKDKIYYIMVSNKIIKETDPPDASNSKKWYFALVKGAVTSGNDEGRNISWETLNFDVSCEEIISMGQLNPKPTDILPSDGFAFVTGDKKNIFFVIKGQTDGKSDKNIIAVFQLEESDAGKPLKLLHVENIENCYPIFFRWEEKIVMTFADYSKQCNKNVMVFDANKKKKFTKSDSSIIFLKDFLKDKRNFATAQIGGKNVLLFTQQKSEDGKSDAHLWMTDGTHVGYVGNVVGGFTGTFYGSLLHTNGELFALHQTYDAVSGNKEENTFSLRRLKNQLNKINFLIKEWEKNNNFVSELCEKSKNPNTSCATPPPTEGLVGFLHSTINEDRTQKIIWKDEYYYSNVTVESGEKVPNGFKFSGEKKGAKWVMESQTGDQPYNFTDPGFTLAATVTVGSGGTSGSHNSVLGVGLTDDTKNVGLWCTAGGKWGVTVGSNQENITPSAVACERGKKYYVLFILDGTEVFVYVNGRKLPDLTNNKIEKKEKITHFYFGADTTSTNTDVTITDVLLYNRPLKTHEIQKFKLQQNDKVDTQQKHENDRTILHNRDDSTIKTDGPSDTSATETDGAETKLRLFSMNGVALFPLLFCVFTLLGRYDW